MNSEYIERIMYFFCSVTIVPLGLLLNFIQFIVFLSKDFKKRNIGFLMSALAVADSISLFWNFIIFQYLPLIGLSLELYSNEACALFLYITRIIQQIPLYFQALVSFINYISVAYSTRCIFIKKLTFSFFFLVIFIFVLIINVPSLFRHIVSTRSNFSNSTVKKICVASNIINEVSLLETVLVRCLIPLFLISVLNLMNLRAIIKLRRDLNMHLNREIRLGVILVLLGLVFILFNFPLACLQIIQAFTNDSSDSIILGSIQFLLDCTRALALSYYGVGFFINIAFNKLFRKNFLRLVKRPFLRK